MGMDALTSAAVKTLHDGLLSGFQNELAALLMLPEQDRATSEQLSFMVSECKELLLILEKWTRGSSSTVTAKEAPPRDNTEDLSQEETLMLMAAMDTKEFGETDTHPAEQESGMSDEEARRLLAQMDGAMPLSPDQTAAPEEMSDEEARRLLAQMDTEVPAAAAASATDHEISDDEARKMLEAMDAPLPQAQQAEDAAPSAAPQPAPQAAEAESFETEEIEEWEKNDFQTDADMVGDFITSSDEIMQSLDEQILALEQNPGSKEIIESIFRAAHTLKGAGGMFGFRAIERVMHRMESLFDKIRKGQLTATSDIIDLVFQGLDVLRALLKAVKDKKPCGIKTAEIVRQLTMAAAGKQVVAAPKISSSKADSGADGKNAAQTHEDDGKNKKDPQNTTIRVDLERLDALVNLVGELVIDRTRFMSIEEELRTLHPNLKLSNSISETVQLFGRHMNDMQDMIMKVRMVPIGNTFTKFTRIVRDLAKSLDKKINLHISGESAELDKTLVELIGDPLIHLIRNSCDHGIELPDHRIASGKDPAGNIYLSAKQEGNSIIIQIKDDGKGINPDIIRKKGIEKGLITEDDKLSPREIFNLIFEPGFSTAEKVTNVSGRGVGMDVVKKSIMKMKGILDIDSKVGEGTTITIQLPLTLAIVQSLLVTIKDEIFAIPLASVIESIRVAADEIQKVGDTEVIKLRNKVLPLVHLDKILNLNAKKGTISDMLQKSKTLTLGSHKPITSKRDKHFVVVVGTLERPFGIVVDHLLNQQEMVIKSMGAIMNDVPAVAGGAVLGNGDVVVVLDIMEIQDNFALKNSRITA